MPVAVVTGAATGVGLATCRLLATRGTRVHGIVRAFSDVPEATQGITWHAADVGDEDAVDRALADVAAVEPAVDLVVSNAAIARHADVADLALADLEAMIRVNLYGFYHLTRAALPLLARAPRPAVVAVASVHAVLSAPLISGYAASKGALVAAVRAVAMDLGPRGVRVNAVLPGSVDTPMLRASARRRAPEDPQAAIDEWGRRHPLGRVLRPEEVAEAVAFLGGDGASGITGACLAVDGGLSARLAL